jgi:hypothetical protein
MVKSQRYIKSIHLSPCDILHVIKIIRKTFQNVRIPEITYGITGFYNSILRSSLVTIRPGKDGSNNFFTLSRSPGHL